jgi:hypothetical protein
LKSSLTFFLALAFMLCTFVFTNAASPPGNSQFADKQMKTCILVVGDNAAGSQMARFVADKSLEIVRISSHENSEFESANLPPVLIAKELVALRTDAPDALIGNARLLNQLKPKTETQKRVNPQNAPRAFYEMPPDITGYNGIGFANLARARPLKL